MEAIQQTLVVVFVLGLLGGTLYWLRRKGPGYQTEINRILREKMEAETVT